MKLTDFTIGEHVEYVLPQSPRNGRPTEWHLPATVVNITKKRLVIRLASSPVNVRVTLPKHVRKFP